MSTTAYRSSHSSRSFVRQHVRTSPPNAILPNMTSDRTRESMSVNSIASSKTSSSIPTSPSLPSQSSSLNSSNDNSTAKTSNKPYTYSNPPRELQRQSVQNMKYLRNSRLRQRVSSAPDENSFQNSPRSVINQQKPSSANESSTPRSHNDNRIPQLSRSRLLQRDEQQKSSLNALMKEQERSKVPRAVQQRRIIFLFRRVPSATSPLVSPRQLQNSSPTKPDVVYNDVNQYEKKQNDEIQHFENNSMRSSSDSSNNDPFHGFDQAEIADSKQLAAILASIQGVDERMPNAVDGGASPRCHQTTFDPTKYEYIAKTSLDTTTFKLSPRTIKPAEDLAARSRFSQNYRFEMLSSANAQIPPLMASIVTENNNTLGSGTTGEKAFTFRLNPTTAMKKQSSLDDIEPMPSNIDGEQVQLCFDEILKCFYDPSTGTYYELTSA